MVGEHVHGKRRLEPVRYGVQGVAELYARVADEPSQRRQVPRVEQSTHG
jgi:hypothetical protein